MLSYPGLFFSFHDIAPVYRLSSGPSSVLHLPAPLPALDDILHSPFLFYSVKRLLIRHSIVQEIKSLLHYQS